MNKLCLLLPNISHAGLESRGGIPEIAKKHGYKCLHHSWPDKYFIEDNELQKILTTIEDYDSIVLISTSFGDLVARKLLKLHHKNIVAHISVCGFGSKKYLTFSSKILLYIAAYLWQFFYKNKRIVKKVAKMFNRPLSPYASKKAHKIHTASCVQGLKKGLSERAKYVLSYEEYPQSIATPGYILFSEDDNNFSPEKNATYIKEIYQKATLLSLGKAGHGSFLEMPEKYMPIIDEILSQTSSNS